MRTFFRNLLNINWFAATYSHDQDVDYLEKKYRRHAAFENQLIHNEKYLQQRGSCDFCENFLLADNSRFAVQY